MEAVCGLIATASRRRQRSATTASRSASVAKWRLATGSSTSGQGRSAGWSSGLYGGKNTKVIPSGTAKPSGPCQPALSSTRTMCRSRPAPAARAKPASRASKKGLLSPVERYQTASPVVGWTKAVTCSHS